MQDHSSTNHPLSQGECSYRRVDFPPHAHLRVVERGGNRALIRARVQTALRTYGDLRGACALTACSPVIVAEFRPMRVCIKTLLEPGMPLKPGTRTVWA